MTGDAPRTGDTARDLLREAHSVIAALRSFVLSGESLNAEDNTRIDTVLARLRTADTPAQQDDALAAAPWRVTLANNGHGDMGSDYWEVHAPHRWPLAVYDRDLAERIAQVPVLEAHAALEAHPPATDAGEALAAAVLKLCDEVDEVTPHISGIIHDLGHLSQQVRAALSARTESAGGQ